MQNRFLLELREAVFAAQRPIAGKLGLDAGAQRNTRGGQRRRYARYRPTCRSRSQRAYIRRQRTGAWPGSRDTRRVRRGPTNTCGRAELKRMGKSELVEMLDKSKSKKTPATTVPVHAIVVAGDSRRKKTLRRGAVGEHGAEPGNVQRLLVDCSAAADAGADIDAGPGKRGRRILCGGNARRNGKCSKSADCSSHAVFSVC